MKFKEFVTFCNNRSADGCWDFYTAITCCNLISEIMDLPFWKREKVWKEFEPYVTKEIINPINEKMRSLEL